MRFCAAVALTVLTLTLNAAADPLRHVRLDTPGARELALDLEHAGFDVLWGSVTDNSLELIVSVPYLQRLRDQGFTPTILAVGRPFRDIQAERQKDAGDDVPPGYPDLPTIIAEMNAAAAAYPAICEVVNVTFRYDMPPTCDGHDLYAVRISDNVSQEEDEPAVLIVSCHHAREIVTPVHALYAIEQFTTLYGTDPQITAAVDNNEIWIAPVWNPDGYTYVFDVDNMWRKNRHVFPTGTGVDQNRNYPFGWDNGCSGSTDPSSETYKGPSAGSEIETQTMMAWSEDQRFAKILDYHSYGREALWAYACWTHPFDNYLRQEAVALATASGYGGSVRAPSADGEHYQWQLATKGALANLVETHTSFQPSYNSALTETLTMWPGILWMVEHPLPLWGHVTNGLTGEPVDATVSLVGISMPNGETNASAGPFGRYQFFVPPGTYDIEIEAAGYESTTVSGIVVDADGSTQFDITLTPPPQILMPNGGESLPVNVETTIAWLGDPALRYQIQATANHGMVDQLTDSFERPELGPGYPTGGDAPWEISYSFPLLGTRSVRAGVISANQQSWMTRNVAGGDVSFWYYISSEANGDFFNFYVDGVREVHASGQGGWASYATTLLDGSHELKWEYVKNGTISEGYDSVWVDYLRIVADLTLWSDVVPLTDPGLTSVPWTPTQLSDTCKVRVRPYYDDTSTYGVWGESADTFSVVDAPPVCPGDADCSGAIDFDDIGFFVAALSGEQAWLDYYLAATGDLPTCSYANCDTNGDGDVDFDDINPFVALLGTTCP